MIMHRTLLFLKGKWRESVILLLLLLLVYFFFFSGVILYHSTALYRDQALAQIGAALQVTFTSESDPSEHDAVDPGTISEVQNIPHVLGVDIAPPSLSGPCLPLGLKPVKKHSGYDPEQQTADLDKEEADSLMHCINLVGCSAIPLRRQFINNWSILSKGMFPTSDSPGILISSDFAELNSLAVKDTVNLSYLYSGQTGSQTEVQIAGIYDTSLAFEILSDNDMGAAVYNVSPYNTVFADFETAAQILEQETAVYSFKVYVDSPEHLEKVKQKILQIPFDWTQYQIYNETLSYYNEYASQIDSVFSGSLKLIVLTAALGITLYIVVFYVWNNSRIRDIGIWKALGESDRRIFTQYITETMLLSLAASLIAVPLSFIFLRTISRSLAPELISSNASYMFVPFYTGEFDIKPAFSVSADASSVSLLLSFIFLITAVTGITVYRLLRKDNLQGVLRGKE